MSILRKKASFLRSSTADEPLSYQDEKTGLENKRPKVLRKGSNRPSSFFGSLKNFRLQEDDTAVNKASAAVAVSQVARMGTNASAGRSHTTERRIGRRKRFS